MKDITDEEVKAAFEDCVKRRGREVALGLLDVFGKTRDLAAIPQSRRLLTTAALERRPPTQAHVAANENSPTPASRTASLHDRLAAIGEKAFAARRKAAD